MENEHVITVRTRRRQSIADDVEATQNKLRLLVQGIDAVDATIKLFQPDMEIGMARIRLTPRRHSALRGETAG